MLEPAWVPGVTGQEIGEQPDSQSGDGVTVISCTDSTAEPHSARSSGLPGEGVSSLSREVCKQLLNDIC